MKIYKAIRIQETKVGKYYVAVLHKSFRTLSAAKKAIDKWERKQYTKDKRTW